MSSSVSNTPLMFGLRGLRPAPRADRHAIKLLLWLAAASGLAITPAAHAQCPPSFAAAVNYNAGTGTNSVAIADFNGDGRPDIVTASLNGSHLTTRMGVGNGTFGAGANVSAGANPACVTVGDFNGDGRVDLVAANSSSSNVSVVLGNGNGTFGSPVNYSVGSYPANFGPRSVAVGDFNGDGRLDLVTAIFGNPTGSIAVLLGNGNGTFGAAVHWGSSMNPWSVAVGDVNGDGRLDIVAANAVFTQVVRVMLGNGDGTFGPQSDYAAGPNPKSVAIGDLSGDGRPDLVVVNDSVDALPNDNTVSVLLGAGGGAFAAATHYPTGLDPSSAAIIDVNADGRLDVAVTNISSNNVSILLGLGNGTLAAPINYATGTSPRSAAFADLNADGRPDLAVANGVSSTFSVLVGNGQQVLLSQQPSDRIVVEGQSTTLGVTAAAATSYRWRRNGVPLADGGRFSGVTTSTLSVSNVQPADAGVYEVLIGSACNAAVLSRPAMLCVQPPPPPQPGIPNDNCSSAILITNGTRTFSTLGATTDGPFEGHLGFCCNEPQIRQDVWFLYTATCTGTVTISTCGTFFDTKLAVYDGAACPTTPSTAMAGNDDSTACGVTLRESLTTFASIAGDQYLIRVGGFAGAMGDAVLNIACEAAPPTCPADFNQSGIVSVQDIFDFLEAYFAGCP